MKNEKIPKYLLKNEICYRTFSHGKYVSILGCGFATKKFPNADTIYDFSDSYSASYILKGKGFLIDQFQNKFDISPGCLLQHNKTTKNSINIDSEWLECFITLKTLEVSDELLRMQIINNQDDFSTFNSLTLPNHTLELFDLLHLENMQSPVIQPGLKLNLVLKVDAILQKMKTANQQNLVKLQFDVLSLLFDFHHLEEERIAGSYELSMVENASRKIIENVTDRTPFPKFFQGMGISYSRLRSIFKKYMGLSPGEFRIQRRIDYACTLLNNSTRSVQSIASELGYNDQFAFSSQFKKITGITPNKFRRHDK